MSDQGNGSIKARVIARLSVAFLTWRRHLQQGLVPHGITLKQLYLLRQLARREFLYPSRIAELLFCDRPTATVIIRNMEKQGWVSREPDEQDRRQVRVVITGAGRAKLEELAQVDRQGEDFDPLGCFDEEEIAELDRLLGKMNEHLKQIRRVK